jgi:hypothetical protein
MQCFGGSLSPKHKPCGSGGRNGETDAICGSAEFGGGVVVRFKLGCGLRLPEQPWQRETAGKRYNHSQSTQVLKFGANDRAHAVTIPSGMDDRCTNSIPSFGAMSLADRVSGFKAERRSGQHKPSEWQGD